MIVIPLLPLLAAIGYLWVGALFAWRMAISPMAVFVLCLLWPMFAIMLALSPLINWWVNREFRN